MPVNKNALVRYRIIDRCLKNSMKKYPSKEFIQDKISFELYGEGGKRVSMSIIEKDFDAMRYDLTLGYNAPIKYSKINKGYFYEDADYSIDGLKLSDQETEALQESVALLKSFGEIPVLKNLTDAIEKINTRFSIASWSDEEISPYMEFEQSKSSVGRDWIKPVYLAIKNRHPIKFTYFNTYKNEIREHELEPHFLKESNNAWYLLGRNDKRNLFLVYHLDKIQSIETDSSRTFLRTDINPADYFKHSLGIMGGYKPAEKIVLEVTGALARSLPFQLIHSSQKIIESSEDRIIIELTLINNEELFRKIITMTGSVKVIEPEELRLKVIEELKKAIYTYYQ